MYPPIARLRTMKGASRGARSSSIGLPNFDQRRRRSSASSSMAAAVSQTCRPLPSVATAAGAPLFSQGRSPRSRAPLVAFAATKGKPKGQARGDDEVAVISSVVTRGAAPNRKLSTSSSFPSSSSASSPLHLFLARAATATAAAVALSLTPATAALAADTAKVGTCLLSSCPAALARCVSDLTCAKSLVCLNKCTGRPDETECQIRCGDLYADSAIETFNACAVSEQKCVPQRVDEGAYPVPPSQALDDKFDLGKFEGRWYITAGLNPLFDTFDCQRHFFGVPEPGKLYAKINWRISMAGNGAGLLQRGGGGEGEGSGAAGAGAGAGGGGPAPPPLYVPSSFSERSTVQTFVQDPDSKALLLNHGNEYLHYEDDWYILDSSLRSDDQRKKSPPSSIGGEENDFVFVYYRGNNDAWRGYGGAVVYTRADSLPRSLVPRLEAAAARAGLKWSDFALTDNRCLPPPPAPPSLLEEVEGEVLAVEREAAKDAQLLEKVVEADARKLERALEADARKLERALEADARAIESEAAEVAEKLAAQLRSFGKFTVLPGKTPVSAKAAKEVNRAAMKEMAAAGTGTGSSSSSSSPSSSRASSSTSSYAAAAPPSSSPSSPSSPSSSSSIATAVKEELSAVERELEDAARYLEGVEARYAPAGVKSLFARLFGG